MFLTRLRIHPCSSGLSSNMVKRNPLECLVSPTQPIQRNTEIRTFPQSHEELILSRIATATISSPSLPLPTQYTTGRSSFTSRTKRSCTIAYLVFAHVSYILGVAEILTESIVTLDNDWCFTPSPDEPDLLNYDYTEEQGTVIAVHSLVKRASLPVDTFILAVLILRHLKHEFYDEWYQLMSDF